MLAEYWAGVPNRPGQRGIVPTWLWNRFVRYVPVDIPDSRGRWLPVAVALRRAARATPAWLGYHVDYMACRAFDRAVARRLDQCKAKAVVACEISARETFKRAKARGMITVLDAPSVHHEAHDRQYGYKEPSALHRRIQACKEEEIELADHIVTVSELAAATYLAAGVPASRVHAVPLGADIDFFTPGNDSEFANRPVRFLFVGATIWRKGIDLLVEAFCHVAKWRKDAELRIVGPKGDTFEVIRRCEVPGVQWSPLMDQACLRDEYRKAHCLVLPSRNDSYGMVVAEALACGTPVIVSDMVGSKMLVREGECGWIVPAEDAKALVERMIWCIDNREQIFGMRRHARAAGASAGWPAHYERYAELMRYLMGAVR